MRQGHGPRVHTDVWWRSQATEREGMRGILLMLGLCTVLLLDVAGGSSRHEHETQVQALCEEGFVLHGRGRWGEALRHFAATVTTHSVWDAIDCVYGAGLSLNTLGQTEVRCPPAHHHASPPECDVGR